MEIVNGWNKGGNLAIAPGAVGQRLAAITAEVTQEQTFVPAEAAGQLLLRSSNGVCPGSPRRLLWPDLRFAGA